jgi:hypothetical protein
VGEVHYVIAEKQTAEQTTSLCPWNESPLIFLD